MSLAIFSLVSLLELLGNLSIHILILFFDIHFGIDFNPILNSSSFIPNLLKQHRPLPLHKLLRIHMNILTHIHYPCSYSFPRPSLTSLPTSLLPTIPPRQLLLPPQQPPHALTPLLYSGSLLVLEVDAVEMLGEVDLRSERVRITPC